MYTRRALYSRRLDEKGVIPTPALPHPAPLTFVHGGNRTRPVFGHPPVPTHAGTKYPVRGKPSLRYMRLVVNKLKSLGPEIQSLLSLRGTSSETPPKCPKISNHLMREFRLFGKGVTKLNNFRTKAKNRRYLKKSWVFLKSG